MGSILGVVGVMEGVSGLEIMVKESRINKTRANKMVLIFIFLLLLVYQGSTIAPPPDESPSFAGLISSSVQENKDKPVTRVKARM